MRAGDLSRAAQLVDQLRLARALRDRLVAGERLRLTLGEAGKESEIVLTSGATAEMRRDLVQGFVARIEALEEGLREIGVEP